MPRQQRQHTYKVRFRELTAGGLPPPKPPQDGSRVGLSLLVIGPMSQPQYAIAEPPHQPPKPTEMDHCALQPRISHIHGKHEYPTMPQLAFPCKRPEGEAACGNVDHKGWCEYEPLSNRLHTFRPARLFPHV